AQVLRPTPRAEHDEARAAIAAHLDQRPPHKADPDEQHEAGERDQPPAHAIPRCCSTHWRVSPPWLQAAPAASAIATKIDSAISASVAPAFTARLLCASMHHGHCVTCATASAISCFVFA